MRNLYINFVTILISFYASVVFANTSNFSVRPTPKQVYENNSLVSTSLTTTKEGKVISEDFLKQIEVYINSLKILSGDFKQISSNGARDSGKFYISKPGRIRLEYNSPILLISDGVSLAYEDKDLDQISYMSIKSHPAAVVLNDNIKITGNNPTVKIKNVDIQNNLVEINLATLTEKQSGTITLLFENSPLSLYGWRVRDAHGITTTVQLFNIKPAKKFNDSLFKINKVRTIGRKKSKSNYY